MSRSFHPPTRLMLGPDASEVPARVLAATARPAIGGDDPAFRALMDDARRLLARAFRAADHACLCLPGPAAVGVEAALLSLLEPGETAVVAVNGRSGAHMAELAARAGAEVVRVEHAWGDPVDPERVEAALWARGAKLLAFAHVDASSGVLSEPGALCALAREHGALSVADCSAALGATAVNATEWEADVMCAASAGAPAGPPGLALLAVSSRTRETMAARRTPPRGWSRDLSRLIGAGGAGEGAPMGLVYGLHEALLALFEEGLEAAFTRHARVNGGVAAGLVAMGLDLAVRPAHRPPHLNVVLAPEGVDASLARATMRERFGVEVADGGGPLADDAWRIGLLGAAATSRHGRIGLVALADALEQQGHAASIRDALAAAEAVWK